MADRYLLESGSPDGYLLEDGSGVLLLESGSTGKAKIAWFGAEILMEGDENRARTAWFGAEALSPLEDQARVAWFGAEILMEGDENRARTAWFGGEVLSPLEDQARVAWFGAEILSPLEDRARVAWFGAEILMDAETELPSNPVPSAECECGPGTWLLDLEVGGRVLRYSTRDLEVVDARGSSYLYRSGLGDIEMSLDGLNEAQGFSVVDRSINWPLLTAETAVTATLRHALPGQLFEQALPILEGAVDEPEVGDPDRAGGIVGTIEAALTDRTWPDPRAVVNGQTWDLAPSPTTGVDPDIVDALYPLVFGYPGDQAPGNSLKVTPALLVYYTSAVLGEAIYVVADGPVEAAQVRLFSSVTMSSTLGFSGADDYPVTLEPDLLGRQVSVIRVPTLGPVIPALGDETYVGWSSAGGFGGGRLLPDRSGPIRSLVDVMIHALRNSGRQVDLQAQESQRDALGRYLIDGMINSEIKWIPWVEQTFGPLFPFVRARTARGIYWRQVEYGAPPTRAIGHLEVGGRVRRASSIRVSREQIRNHFQLDFKFGAGVYNGRRVLSAESEQALPWYQSPDLLEDSRVIGSALCAASQRVFGIREADLVQTKFVGDDGTASAIQHGWAIRDAFPRRKTSYTAPQVDVRRWSRGDIVLVTDPELSASTEVAMVQTVALSSSSFAVVAVEVLDRRARLTS